VPSGSTSRRNITEMAREQGVLTGAPWVRASSPSRAIAPGRSISQPAATSSLTTTTPAPSSRRPTPCSLENDLLCLEVMYAGDLPEQLQWDTLYHEHVTFYSLGHLAGLLRGHGFEPVHADSHARGRAAGRGRAGGHPRTRRVVADLRSWERERMLNEAPTWDRFADDCRRRIEGLRADDAPPLLSRDDLGLRRCRQGDDVGERVRDDVLRPAHAAEDQPALWPRARDRETRRQAAAGAVCLRPVPVLRAGVPSTASARDEDAVDPSR
jgi:hypothetical protein